MVLIVVCSRIVEGIQDLFSGGFSMVSVGFAENIFRVWGGLRVSFNGGGAHER